MRSSANQWLNVPKRATNHQRADHIEEERYDMGMISISAVVVIVCTGPGQFDLSHDVLGIVSLKRHQTNKGKFCLLV